MSEGHSAIAPELRQLAQSILDRLDPAIRLVAARAQAGGDSAGQCQQTWCPVCALAALIAGEQHPLLDVVAEHSVSLLALVRAMLDDMAGSERSGNGPPSGPGVPSPDEPSPPDPAGPGGPPPSPPGRYQHIPVSVDE